MATKTSHLGLAKPTYTEKADVQAINGNMDILDKEVAKRTRVNDLVDNGYFPEAVNQRGVTSTTAWGKCLDRWISRGTGIGISTDENGLHMSSTEAANVFIYQKLRTPAAQMLGKKYTVAVCDSDGNIACKSTTLPTEQPAAWSTYGVLTLGNISACIRVVGTGEHDIAFSVGRPSNNMDDVNVRWVALYPGSYTLDTLPVYVQKENTLAECQRHAVKTRGHGWGYTVNSTTLRLNIPVPTTLRVTPSIPAGLTFTVIVDGSAKTVTEYSVNTMDTGVVRLTLTGTGFPSARTAIVGYANKDFVFSSDL